MQNAHLRLGRLQYTRNTEKTNTQISVHVDHYIANGTAGQTFIMNLEQTTKDLTWATVVNLLGLPGDPRWGNVVLSEMRKDKLIRRLDGIGCNPAVVIGTREDLMKRIRQASSMNLLPFPEKNGPIVWPQYTIRDALAPEGKQEECSGSVSG
jgi:hypothetical protein